MKVARLAYAGHMKIYDESLPSLEDNQVLVKVKSVGICGSDLHYFRHGGLGSFKVDLPMDIGHEVSGEVVDPNGNTQFRKGMKVAIEPGHHCGKCYYCELHLYNHCENMKFLGANDVGAIREYLALEPNRLFPSPRDISYDDIMMLEPLAVAMYVVKRITPKKKSNVYIIGAGTIGLLVLQLCNFYTKNITVGDFVRERRAFASKYNTKLVYSPQAYVNLKNKADIVYECAGTQSAIHNAIKFSKKLGTVVLVGIPEYDHVRYNPHQSRIKELTFLNIRRTNVPPKHAMNMVEHGLIDVSDFVTHKFNIEDTQEAFETASKYRDGVIKAVINP